MNKEEWKIGDCIAQDSAIDGDFYGVWHVHEIQERGLIVALRNGSHKHLMEWSRVKQGRKI